MLPTLVTSDGECMYTRKTDMLMSFGVTGRSCAKTRNVIVSEAC